jgi:hypothetical protein
MNIFNQRRKYLEEQDKFLISIVNEPSFINKKSKWKEIAERLKRSFPEVQPQRSSKELQNHYFNSLDSPIKREQFSLEEDDIIIQYVSQKGKH